MDLQTVVVVGASPKPHRFSNQALRLLIEHNYRVIPVHPLVDRIENISVAKSLRDIAEPVHTVTVYVGCRRSVELIDALLALKPKRVILNPGAECTALADAMNANSIAVINDCTLVMLRAGRF